MSSENLEAVRKLAPDLRQQNPRSPREKLAGLEIAARTLDKCRASLAGTNGDYEFNCPMDQKFFAATGIDADAFRSVVATGASDEEVEKWVKEHARSSGE